MKVKELIEKLQGFDPELDIICFDVQGDAFSEKLYPEIIDMNARIPNSKPDLRLSL